MTQAAHATPKENYYATPKEEAEHASVYLKIRPTRFIPLPKAAPQ